MLEVRLGFPEGTLDGPDLERANAALLDASTLAGAEVSKSTRTRWLAVAPEVVVLVVLKAAKREFENPRGLATETLGEHAVGLTDTSGVYLTEAEVKQIKRAATGQSGFTGTVRTPSAYEREDRYWFPTFPTHLL